MDDLTPSSDAFLKEIAAAQSPEALEQVRVKLLGRNGAITSLMRGLGALPQEQRREAGAKLNVLRDQIAAALSEAGERLRGPALAAKLAGERADVSLPGRTFRADHDATHSPMFHQVEGLVIDRARHMGHLKGCLIEFCRAFFDVEDLPVRFRPSYFPFTEPSAEVDIGCSRQGGELKIGAGGDWLEILGSGMVHPQVLKNCGIDPAEYQGFAFGMGIERVAMLKYGIPDLRTFYDSDLRWLRHYGFLPLDIPSPVHGPLAGGAA